MINKKNKDKTEGLHPANYSSQEKELRHEYKALSEEMQGDETILVVEDEEQVRELVVEMLKTYGYKVLDADNGKKAIEIYNTYYDEIRLILTDVVMPEMGGKKLIENLVNFKDSTKVVYMSGYTQNTINKQGILEPDTEFIQKPFSPIDLLKKIRQVLDG